MAGRGVVAIWFAAMIGVGALLMMRHLFPLPIAEASSAGPSARAFRELGGPSNGWRAVHVLFTSCRCSGRIVDHLTSTTRPPDLAERALIVGGEDPDIEARLVAAGIAVEWTTAEELERRFGVESGPLLVVIDPQDHLRYAGGYTRRKQSLAVEDAEIVAALRDNRAPDELPIYGCAISQRLRNTWNPLGF